MDLGSGRERPFLVGEREWLAALSSGGCSGQHADLSSEPILCDPLGRSAVDDAGHSELRRVLTLHLHVAACRN